MSRASPRMGGPGGKDDRHWSGTEYQNQKRSEGLGKISIDRSEREATIFRPGRKTVPTRRPSAGGIGSPSVNTRGHRSSGHG